MQSKINEVQALYNNGRVSIRHQALGRCHQQNSHAQPTWLNAMGKLAVLHFKHKIKQLPEDQGLPIVTGATCAKRQSHHHTLHACQAHALPNQTEMRLLSNVYILGGM